MRHRGKIQRRFYCSAALFLAMVLLVATLVCVPSKAESSIQQWNIGSDVSLAATKDNVTLQCENDQAIRFVGSLRTACLEQTGNTVCLLLQRSDGLYCDFYHRTSKETVCTTSPLSEDIDTSAFEAGIGPALQCLYLHCRTIQGKECLYRIQEDSGKACCIEDTTQPLVIWNSIAATCQQEPVSSEESAADSQGSSTSEGSTSTSQESAASSQQTVDSSSQSESSTESGSSSQEEVPETSRIYRFSGPMTVSELEQMILTLHSSEEIREEEIRIFTANGVAVTTGAITTGDVIKDHYHGKIETVQLVIPGDLCGSGHPDKSSYQLLRKCVAGGEPLRGLTALAADMTASTGNVSKNTKAILTTADLLLLKRAAGI